jgi:iron(III) transport system substrate-binding protein
MLSSLLRRRWLLPVLGVVVVLIVVGAVLVSSGGNSDALVIYNGRSHYGEEQVFRDFSEETGIEIELRGGTGPELFERLQSEGSDTPADLLVTTDLANLWRAEDAGLLEDVTTPELEANVPDGLHDPDGAWWAITTRLRVPVVSTERVPEGAVDSYEDLADPQFRGRVCLRTSDSEYNQSFVADMIAKRGEEATRELLHSWMDNDPEIINSDGEILGAMEGGECDVALINHYYLARSIDEDPDFPVEPAWPDQHGDGAHANVSGAGVVVGSDHEEEAIALLEYLTTEEAQSEIASRGEFPVNEAVPPAEHVSHWDDVVIDPIDVEQAGPLLDEALALMLDVGWN